MMNRERGSSTETHKASSLAWAAYNATQRDEAVSLLHHFSGNGCKGNNMRCSREQKQSMLLH